jgi:dihydrolipoamide dehydrogenase
MVYDVGIIGGGPGGYTCAIRCGQLGLRTVLVEEAQLGGVCLNWGCIPTKALLSATKLLWEVASASEMGIAFGKPSIDIEALAAWKSGIVSQLTSGISQLVEKNGTQLLRARGRLAGKGRIELASGDSIEANRIVLATGSRSVELPTFPFDADPIWSSDGALALQEIPEHLIVIGGGVIGLELATIYRRLGSVVTVAELLPEVLSTVDLDRRTVATLKRELNRQGIDLRLGVQAESWESRGDGVRLNLANGDSVDGDRILVAVGRRPNIEDLGLEEAGVKLDPCGCIAVDEALETSVEGVHAIGDVVPGPMLAHKATAEAIAVAAHLAGQETEPVDHGTIPQAIFTDPEIASVGLSESKAKDLGEATLVGRFPYAALGKALGMREEAGFFQVVARASDHRLLGAQIVGAEASDLIAEAGIALQNGLTLEAIADSVHAHPTLPEGLKEAAENALGRAIHTVNR